MDTQLDESIVDETEEAEEAEPVVEDPPTPQAIFGSTVFAGGAGRKTTRIESAATHTCYLRGIRGALRGTQGNWGDRITTYARLVVNANNDWEAQTYPGYGSEVYVDVSCVLNTTNRWFLSKTHGGAGNDAPVTSRRRCFLTGITAFGGAMSGRLWNNDLPGARVWTYGGSWRVSTWFNDQGEAIPGSASAVCIDFSGLGETGDHYYENGTTQIFDGAATDWACGAMGYFGVMTSSTAGGRSYKQDNRWWVSASANRGVLTRCHY